MKVESGVPQGSVIGPASFVTFINDLPDAVSSNIFMFADDTKMSKGITNHVDRKLLQSESDIENLVNWSTKWKLPFDSTKCKIMTLCHNQVTSNYTMAYTDSTVTVTAKSVLEKELGILIDNELG